MTEPSLIRTEHLHRIYVSGGDRVHAINDVSLEIPTHQITMITGRSGSGKTTLLNLISGLDSPSEGKVWVENRDLFSLTPKERIGLRREKIGFIFQNFGLLPLLTAAENVGVPLRMRKVNRHEREGRVKTVLEWVGMENRAHHRPYELSGGEQQRVAIARALCAQPDIILADEPTGQLDTHTGQGVLTLLQRLVVEQGITLVIVTHNLQVADMAERVYRLHDGKLN